MKHQSILFIAFVYIRKMIKVSVIGSGNVAHHIIKALSINENVDLIEVYARNTNSLFNLLPIDKVVSDINLLKDADLYIIAVSDCAIAEISDNFNLSNQLVVHTSGSFGIDDLNSKNRKGVFYPLQTFSKSKSVDFKTVPICIEAQNKDDLELISKVAHSISDKVYNIDSSQRKAMHVAAVFVSNFVNHLYQIGSDICVEKQIPFDILLPLIQETAQKIAVMTPQMAQTGPAKRGDLDTINGHLTYLSDKNNKEIYSILTQSIIEHGKKL